MSVRRTALTGRIDSRSTNNSDNTTKKKKKNSVLTTVPPPGDHTARKVIREQAIDAKKKKKSNFILASCFKGRQKITRNNRGTEPSINIVQISEVDTMVV